MAESDAEESAREAEVPGGASGDKKRRYRILPVPFVSDPTRRPVPSLANPVGMATHVLYCAVRAGSVKHRFELG